jgi:hypothetical protein
MKKKLYNYLDPKHEQHPFHIVDPSPWPIMTLMALWSTALGFIMFFHYFNNGAYHLLFGIFSVGFCLTGWFLDVIIESTFQGFHTYKAQQNIYLEILIFSIILIKAPGLLFVLSFSLSIIFIFYIAKKLEYFFKVLVWLMPGKSIIIILWAVTVIRVINLIEIDKDIQYHEMYWLNDSWYGDKQVNNPYARIDPNLFNLDQYVEISLLNSPIEVQEEFWRNNTFSSLEFPPHMLEVLGIW